MRLSLPARRPVFSVVISLLLIVLGVAALLNLPVRQYPDIDPPIITVNTFYRGAAGEVVVNEVTERIEDAISGVRGIDIIESTSRDEVSTITIQFETDRDIDLAAVDVREAVSQVIEQLPEQADRPVIEKANTGGGAAMMWITLTSDVRTPMELTDYAERNLTDPLSIVNGVARVLVGGARRYAMRIKLDPEALAARGLTVSDVLDRLQQENFELPAGRIEGGTRESTVRVMTRLSRPEEFEDIVLLDDPGTQGRVLLGDVADVRVAPENDRTAVLEDQKPAIGLGVIRQSDANTLAVANRIRAEMRGLQEVIPSDINYEISYDQSIFIRQSIRGVLLTLGIAVMLVIGVIWLFLGSVRATIIPSVTIPVSVIATFAVLYALGFSINVLTLLAVILAIGLVADDSIVVVENIYRRIEKGEPRLLASVTGLREVAFAVIATTAVLVSVFLPISFQQGRVGRLFTEFGITLAAAVIFSSLVALTLAPTLASSLLKKEQKKNIIARGFDKVFDFVARGYEKVLGLTLRIPWMAVIVLLAGYAGVWFAWQAVPEELAPTEDRGSFYIIVEAPQGSTLEYTQNVVDQILGVLQPYYVSDERMREIRNEQDSIFSWLGLDTMFGGGGEESTGGQPQIIEKAISIVAPGGTQSTPVNEAFVIVKLIPWSARSTSQMALVEQLFGRLSGIPGAQIIPVNPPGFNLEGTNQPVQFVMRGPNYETVKGWGEQLLGEIRSVEALQRPRLDLETTKPRLEVEVDRDALADLGLSSRAVAETLGVLFGAREVTDYEDRGELYEVLVEALDSEKDQVQDLRFAYVRTPRGEELIPLAGFVETRMVGAPKEFRRINRLPAATISSSLAEGASLGDVLNQIEGTAEEILPSAARFTYLGQSRQYVQTAGQIFILFAFAITIAFLVLSAQFESFIHPLIILLTVPLAVLGALGALIVFGQSLNVYSQIALVMIIGLVAKNAILVVEFANQVRDRGEEILASVREAARVRFRPVMMTSASTLLGALPLVLAGGAGAEGRQVIGIVVMAGIIFATLTTLLIVPSMYLLLARFTKPVAERSKKLKEQREEQSEGSEKEEAA